MDYRQRGILCKAEDAPLLFYSRLRNRGRTWNARAVAAVFAIAFVQRLAVKTAGLIFTIFWFAGNTTASTRAYEMDIVFFHG